jgi:hypothetical protein
MLVGDYCGYLKLISSIDGKLIKDFRRVHYTAITGIVKTEDKKLFFASSRDGQLKQWNFEDNTLVKDHGKITNNLINSLSL